MIQNQDRVEERRGEGMFKRSLTLDMVCVGCVAGCVEYC